MAERNPLQESILLFHLDRVRTTLKIHDPSLPRQKHGIVSRLFGVHELTLYQERRTLFSLQKLLQDDLENPDTSVFIPILGQELQRELVLYLTELKVSASRRGGFNPHHWQTLTELMEQAEIKVADFGLKYPHLSPDQKEFYGKPLYQNPTR